MIRAPRRIVCLSAEAADWLWRIGAWDSVVGVTAHFSPQPDTPPKPRVSSFSTARFDGIVALEPDFVITFSDVQATLGAELVKRGLSVLATNQRTLSEIEATLALLGRVVGREHEAEKCLREFRQRLAPVESNAPRPRVYFEEWNDPFISGIAWVSELIERAGGEDIFADFRQCRAAAQRVVTSKQICHADPEVIIASWCGKPVRMDEIAARPGWDKITAVRSDRIYEIPGDDILQPGFRLVHGYENLKEIIGGPAKCNRFHELV